MQRLTLVGSHVSPRGRDHGQERRGPRPADCGAGGGALLAAAGAGLAAGAVIARRWWPGERQGPPARWECPLDVAMDPSTRDEHGRPQPVTRVASGSAAALAAAVAAAADVAVSIDFVHNEHIDVRSQSSETIDEGVQYQCVYLLHDGQGGEDGHVAALQTYRQPIDLGNEKYGVDDGFGPRPSLTLSFAQTDGHKAMARPFLDGAEAPGEPGRDEGTSDHLGDGKPVSLNHGSAWCRGWCLTT